MKRIAIFGGRDYENRARVHEALDLVLEKHGPFVLVHGKCPSGVDQFAHEWHEELVLASCQMPTKAGSPYDGTEEAHAADWDTHGRAAGPIRNREMAQSGLHGAIEFPGGRGTASMRRELQEEGVPIWVWK